MTIQTTLAVSNDPLAGPARQGGGTSPFWRRVEELLTLRRLHANSDAVLEIAMRYDLDDCERLQELERLVQKEPNQQGADMLQTTTTINLNTTGLSVAENARNEASALATDINRMLADKQATRRLPAVSKVFAELVAETVVNRQLGPVEGLLDEIESNIDFDNSMQVRQYARGLAALIEDCRCRLANL